MIPSKRIGMEVILRAIAISAVVYNHAHVYGSSSVTYAGGMTVLMLLSGLSFARFALTTESPARIREAAFNLGKLLALPSIAMAIFSFFYMQQFSLAELLLVSNWFEGDYIARFPIWYTEVMVQMLVIVILLFSIPSFAKVFFRHPLASSMVLLGVAVLIRLALPKVPDTSTAYSWLSNTSALYNRLPHLFLWNFVLGWVLYYASAGDRPIAFKVVVIGCAAVSGLVGWSVVGPQSYWLALAVALLLFLPAVRLPTPLVRPVTIVSQASFAIFLLHTIGLGAYRAIFPWQSPELAWLFSMIGCVVFWVAMTALIRAYRETRKSVATGADAPAPA